MTTVDTYINRNNAYSFMHQIPHANQKDKGNHRIKHHISELDRLCFNLDGQHKRTFTIGKAMK